MSATALRRMADEAQLSPDLLQQALEWLVTIWSREATTDELRALERWRGRSVDHERAWQQVQRISGRLAAVPVDVGASSLRAAQTVSSNRRRQILRVLAGFGIGGAGVYIAGESRVAQTYLADHRTATGEIREIELEDGTRVVLNTRSAVALRFSASERRLRLVGGEVMIVSASDPRQQARPFIVETVHGWVQPIGTRFTVRRDASKTQVAVFEGAVRIQPEAAPAALQLDAGQRTWFSVAGVESPSRSDETQTAWTRGMLVVERMRLADFLEELSRYRAGVIRCDPAIADLRVSGTYPLADTGRILQALVQALPIRVRDRSRFWVVVEAA